MSTRILRCRKALVSALLLVIATLQNGACLKAESDKTLVLSPAQGAPPVLTGTMQNAEIIEASGVAASRLDEDLLWIINDGGSGEFLYAVGTDGADKGKVRLENASNVDWEDLASFRHNDEAFLLIGDFGDNRSERPVNQLYFVREPSLKGPRFEEGRSVPWIRRIQFVYAEGAFDCEGLGVDVRQEKILVLTKRTRPPAVYELPLFTAGKDDAVHVAKRLADIVHIPPPSAQDLIEDPRYGRFRSQPTALDVSHDSRRAAILTYKHGYIYDRLENESWAVAFSRAPQPIRMPKLRQSEALCFNANGRSLYVTSEKRPAPLYRIDLLP